MPKTTSKKQNTSNMQKSNSSGVALTKRLYSIAEASTYLGRSVWSVRELIWDGKLPAIKVGRRIHLDIYDLDGFVEKYKVREYF